MSEWKKVKIGDIFAIEKGSLQSSKCSPGSFDFITAATDWKTHDSYSHECEAIVYAVAASGSLGRAHYVNGKFIASDLCFVLTEKNKEKYPVNFLFYQIVFDVLRDDIVSRTKSGTSKESINQKNFSNYEIPYFDYSFQLDNFEKLVKVKNYVAKILEECRVQRVFLSDLRQNILQDAIEGKLTEDWRKKHPVIKGDINYDAEALYNHIQQEKQNLIAAGKIKKEKPLPEIKVEEMSLHVPNNWLYVRLGDVAEGFQYGTASKSESEGKCPVLRMGNVQNGIVDWEKLVYTNDDDEIEKYKLTRDDLIFNRTNSREWVGKTCIYNSDRQAIYAGYLVRFRVLSQNAYFANYVLNSKYHREWCNDVKSDALGQSNINAEKLKNFIFPIAPLAEQNEIVARVESCLKKIDELELQIATRETYAKTLLQTTLHTTFNS